MKVTDETVNYLAEFYLNDSDFFEAIRFVHEFESSMKFVRELNATTKIHNDNCD